MRILFIVNPISGLGLGKELPDKIKKMPEYDGVGYDIVFTEYAGHARILVEEARTTGKYSHIVAVGGDGTVNEVGGALCGSDIAFAVVSLGSGNGFARHLGYSIFMNKALKQVLTDQYARIDVLQMNDKYSLNVSGVGFDAEVAHEFNHLKLRGVLSYIYAAIKLWFRYPEKKYKITSDGKVMKVSCFILSFANSSQYGNNAYIAPHASMRDGLMDICILKRPAFFEILWFLLFFVSAKLYKLSYYKEIQCQEAVIEGDIHRVHIDGDAYTMDSPLHLKVLPGVLKVVVPKCLDNA
ncbi:MAG: diacylglycerol kinase family protein [Odoribacter sp.]